MNHPPKRPQGSILIWTILLGLALATAFLYFSQRLNFNALIQRKAIESQNAELFFESYADHLLSLSADELMESKIEFETISGVLSNQTQQIKGVLDAGETIEYKIEGGDAKIEWGLCDQSEAGFLLEVTPHSSLSTGNCGLYDGIALSSGPTITLHSPEVPLHYKITPQPGTLLFDHTWHLELEMPVNSKKTLFLEQDFVPGS